jgi:hypothetical protein
MVERYVKTIEEHLRKVVSTHQKDWDERLPIFLLAYRASTHDTTGMTPANMVFGRELRLPCDLLFGAPPQTRNSQQRTMSPTYLRTKIKLYIKIEYYIIHMYNFNLRYHTYVAISSTESIIQ